MPLVTTRANAASIGYLNGRRKPLPYMWVIVGDSGKLWTSTSSTASSWTSRTSSFGSTALQDVASDGTMFVAVGQGGKLATSTDGITWTQRTSSFGTSDISNVAYGADGYWVACGADGKIATSRNGIDWTQRTSGTSNQLACVAYGNGLWLVGESGGDYLRRATDPTSTWTSTPCTLSNAPVQQSIYYWKQQSIWVLGSDGGTTGALASSTDGITWTARTSAFTGLAFGGVFISNSSTLAFASLKSIVFPTTADVQSSTNGTTWTDRTLAASNLAPQNGAVDDTGLMAIVGSLFDSSGNGQGISVQTSSNGTTWTSRTSPSTSVNDYTYGLCHSYGLPTAKQEQL